MSLIEGITRCPTFYVITTWAHPISDNGNFELCDVDQIECLKELENTLRQVSAAASINQVPQNVAQIMKENNINCLCLSGTYYIPLFGIMIHELIIHQIRAQGVMRSIIKFKAHTLTSPRRNLT